MDENETLTLKMIEVRMCWECGRSSICAELHVQRVPKVVAESNVHGELLLPLELVHSAVFLGRFISASQRQDDVLEGDVELFSCTVDGWSDRDPATTHVCRTEDHEIQYRVAFTESFDTRAIIPSFDLGALFEENLDDVNEFR